MQKTINKILALLVSVTMFSCNSTDNIFTDKAGNKYEVNRLYDINLNDDVAYTIYFPEACLAGEKLPVLFLLDPHAQGHMPVNKYYEVANKYGYILVGSNVSRNGINGKVLDKHINNLLAEISKKYSVDKKRFFIGGFSGGAKLAIMFANNRPEFIGAMACGGAVPFGNKEEPRFYYVGLVGDKDFNYLEMRQSFQVFDQYGFDYTAEVFDGAHEWPTAESFEMGLIGFDIYSAKIKRKTISEEWQNKVKEMLWNKAELLAQQSEILNQYEALQQGRRWFYGLSSVTKFQKEIALLTQTQAFNSHLKKRQQLVQQELKLRQEFIKAIEIRDIEWWENEIAKINKASNNKTEAFIVKQRLLNYVSMATFMLTKNDLVDEKLDNALNKIQIYELVDPTNPDVYLMKAQYSRLSQDYTTMNKNYSKAVELGFNDRESYINESFWEPLFNHPELN